ncbi:MAG: nucleotidyltransferase domain-containing protein [Candidatus Bathyarchaeia archaeon]
MKYLTPAALNVLHFLLSKPIRQFHEREIVRRTGVSVGAVNQILKKLHEAGLVEKDRRGRTNFYRADLKSPVARQFKVLFNVWALNDLVDQIKQTSERVVLFGSCAEGTNVEESDIDLFVLSSDVQTVKNKISEYELMLDRKISPIVVDSTGFVEIKRKDKSLYERISRGIRLWEQE